MANQPPLDSYLKLHNIANDRVGQANWKRGVINAIYPSQGVADVQLVGSHSTILKSIYFGSGINPNAVKVGDKCLVWLFSEKNPDDAFIQSIYGRKLTNSASGTYGASVSSALGGVTIKIPHPLGVVPTTTSISNNLVFNTTVGGGTYTFGTLITSVDANYIYVLVKMNDNSTHSFNIFWTVSSV